MSGEGRLLNNKDSEYRKGVLCVLGCQTFWGIMPIYWYVLTPIDSKIIILYRVLTMFIFTLAFTWYKYGLKAILEPLKDRSVVWRHIFSGAVLTANWSIYVWAMTSERVLECAIGYFIEPLVMCLFGVVLFKEKINKYNGIAMGFGLIAILIILFHYKQLPMVALGLTFTWAIYSAMKKTSDIPALIAMTYETALYAVIALVAIIYVESHGIGALALNRPGLYALMLLSGLFTLIPVGLFGTAAPKVPFIVLGLAQYISPTMTMLLGIFAFKEQTDKVQIIAFIIIWIGLVFFTTGEFKRFREITEAEAKTAEVH